MNHLSFPSCRRLFWLLASVTLAALPAPGVETLPGLRQEVAANPSQAPGAVVRLIRSPESAQPRWAARVTVAALQGLGPQATTRQTAAIVYAAVRAAPEHVLEIVHAATLASPNDQAPNIAAAAVAATPHPFQKVKYHRDATPLSEYRAEGDHARVSDGKEISDHKAVATPDRTLTLAEAIAQTTDDARTGISSWAVLAAVDETLVGSPDWLIGAMNNSSMLAAFGDSGLSNFGNEPIIPAVLAPTVPAPPPVSP